MDTKRFYIPNTGEDPKAEPFDPERGYDIRGNGMWTWRPPLTAEYKKAVVGETNIAPAPGIGLMCANPAQGAEVVFKVNGANIITSQTLRTEAVGKASVEISTNNGLSWQELAGKTSEGGVMSYALLKEVNACYEVLVKVKLAASSFGAKVHAPLPRMR